MNSSEIEQFLHLEVRLSKPGEAEQIIMSLIAENKVLREALTELLRLYDWRNELAAEAKANPNVDQRQRLLIYGRKKKIAWDVARAALKQQEHE